MNAESPRSPLEGLVGRILLRCPKCRREQSELRQPYDYPEAVRVEIQCPKCNPGDFDHPHYFAADGSEIVRDPAEPPNAALSGRGPTQHQETPRPLPAVRSNA